MENFDPANYEKAQMEKDAHILFEALEDCELQPVEGSPEHMFMWNAITEQTPRTPRELMIATARLMCYMGKDTLAAADFLSSEEDRGALLTAYIQMLTGLDLSMSRWVTQPKEGRPSIPLKMEYAITHLYFDGLNAEEETKKIAVVDDLISTGGTMISQCKAIREQTKHKIVGVVLLADKGYGGKERLKKELHITPTLVAQMDLKGERSRMEQLFIPFGNDMLKEFRKTPRQYFDNGAQVKL